MVQLEIPSTIASSSAKHANWFPVRVGLSNEGMKISALDLEKRIGSTSLHSSAVILQLRARARIVLTATVVVPENHRELLYIQASLRIVLYGFMSEKQVVAKILSDGDLYLQHPSQDECDRRVPYFNPQYLLRPGKSMPELESLNIPSPGRLSGNGRQGFLTEAEKRRLLQVFESAYDPNVRFGTRPSLRLKSALKEYVAQSHFKRRS